MCLIFNSHLFNELCTGFEIVSYYTHCTSMSTLCRHNYGIIYTCDVNHFKLLTLYSCLSITMKIIFVFFLVMSYAVATIPLFNTVMRSVNLRQRYVCILCIIAYSCFSDISYTRQTVAQVRCIHYLLLIRHTSTLYQSGLSPLVNSLLLRLSKCPRGVLSTP